MRRRHLVAAIDSVAEPAIGLPVRQVAEADAEALAALMLDAYAATIDADGSETIQNAREEVESFFAGASGEPMLAHSHIAVDADRVVGAILVARYQRLPFIAYLMTAASHKGRGLATGLTVLALARLGAAGERQAHLYVTAANEPAERIYARLGFSDVPW